MDMPLQTTCDSLIENYRSLAIGRWGSAEKLLLGASLYTALDRDRSVDLERIEKCESILRRSTNAVSPFRRELEFPICCRMALAEDPIIYFDRLVEIFRALSSATASAGEYTISAAMIMAELEDLFGDAAVAQKVGGVFRRMQSAHPWQTAGSELPLATLMALSGRNPDEAVQEADMNCICLRRFLHTDTNTCRSISYLLTIFEGSAEDKCSKVCVAAKTLKDAGYPMRGPQTASLSSVAGSAQSPEAYAKKIIEADEYLKNRKPFKNQFSIDTRGRRMFAAQMTEYAFPASFLSGSGLASWTVPWTVAVLWMLNALVTAAV